jgi:hypothetical protein
VRKYKHPWTHEAFQDATLFDLLTEFYEDLYESDPKALLDAGRGADGEIVFGETGDPLIDKWEEEMARGLTPDLTEAMSKEDLAKLQKKAAESKKLREAAKGAASKIEEMDFDFTDPRMVSKFVGKGSAEEAELLGNRMVGRAQAMTDATNQMLGRRR